MYRVCLSRLSAASSRGGRRLQVFAATAKLHDVTLVGLNLICSSNPLAEMPLVAGLVPYPGSLCMALSKLNEGRVCMCVRVVGVR